jgi:hypothetical protein
MSDLDARIATAKAKLVKEWWFSCI